MSLTHTRYTTWVLEQVLHGQCSRLSLPARVWLCETRCSCTLSAGHASLNHPSACAHSTKLPSSIVSQPTRFTSEPGSQYSQVCKSSLPYCRRDGLDGSQQRVQQQSQAACGTLYLALFVQNKSRQRHRIDVYLVREGGSQLRHGYDSPTATTLVLI